MRRKMKMNRTGLLFIVIQFLMTRAKMLERLGREQFQHGFSLSSLWKKSSLLQAYIWKNNVIKLIKMFLITIPITT